MAYVFFMMLALGTALFLYRKSSDANRKFIVLIFVTAFIARCVISMMLTGLAYLSDRDGFISGDELLYSQAAEELPRKISEGNFTYKVLWFGMNIYTYLLAFFYRLFGYDLMASKFINCYIGSLIPLAAYFLAGKLINDTTVKKIAAAISAFYPSLVFWSISNIKEPLIILSFCAGTWLFLRAMSRQLTVADMIMLALYASLMLNLQLIYSYQIVLILAVIIFRYATKPVKIAVSILMIGGVFLLLSEKEILKETMLFMERHQLNRATADAAGYTLYPTDYAENLRKGTMRLSGLIPIYLKACGYFLFSPFPWNAKSVSQLIAIPQILIWYVLLLLALIGFIKYFKRPAWEKLALFMFVFVGISFWALTEGNVGGAFRHRDHFAIIIFIFAGLTMKRLFVNSRNKAIGQHKI